MTSRAQLGAPGREGDLVRTFVRLADTLVASFDLHDLARDLCESCTRLLAVDAAGILLVHEGELQVLAASEERLRLLELFQVQAREGACVDCFRDHRPVAVHDLRDERDRWPAFTERALEAGYRAALALPLRHGDRTIGALNLFAMRPGPVPPADVEVARALADTATIAVLEHRAAEASDRTTAQLRAALESRVRIEQAKGVLAERHHLDLEQAFERLRAHARSNRRRLHEVAADVVAGTLDLEG